MFQLRTHNGTVLSAATVYVSTIKLPVTTTGGKYETCIFTEDGSEVVERYWSSIEAAIGHAKHCRRLGLK